MRKLAYAYGQQMIWSEVAKGYRTLFERVVATHRQQCLAFGAQADPGQLCTARDQTRSPAPPDG